MIYLITYLSDNETRTLEWITPTNWSPVEISECFNHRFPEAELIKMEPIE